MMKDELETENNYGARLQAKVDGIKKNSLMQAL